MIYDDDDDDDDYDHSSAVSPLVLMTCCTLFMKLFKMSMDYRCDDG
jgi:hypothetical protein